MSETAQIEINTALFEYCLKLGDNGLILGHRLSEWCGHGPILEEDIAMTNIALDLVGQARGFLTYAAEVEGKGRTEDDLAYLRDVMQFRNFILVEQPNGDFAHTMTRQYFFSLWAFLHFSQLVKSTDETLAGLAQKSLKEITYHLRHASEWMRRLGDGTKESNSRLQQAVNNLWIYTEELFVNSESEKMLTKENILPGNEQIKADWNERVSELMTECNITLPAGNIKMVTGINKGGHSEHLGHLLAEMQFLPRAYPNSQW